MRPDIYHKALDVRIRMRPSVAKLSDAATEGTLQFMNKGFPNADQLVQRIELLRTGEVEWTDEDKNILARLAAILIGLHMPQILEHEITIIQNQLSQQSKDN